jgi:hypothetical protein
MAMLTGLTPKLRLMSLMVLNLLSELKISSSSFSFLYYSTVLATGTGGGGSGFGLIISSYRFFELFVRVSFLRSIFLWKFNGLVGL